MIHKVLPVVALMAEIEGTLGRYTTSSFGSLKETLRPRIVGDLRPCVLCNKLQRFLICIAFSRYLSYTLKENRTNKHKQICVIK